VRYARWNEINFEKKEWRIPARRELIKGVEYSDREQNQKRALGSFISSSDRNFKRNSYVYWQL
jgi:hypothetical protein